MKEKIICFSLGLSEEDIKKGKDSYYALNEEAPLLELMAVTGFMLERKVGDVLADVITGFGEKSAEQQTNQDSPCPYRMVIVLAQEREQVLQVMRSFKAVLPDPQDIIFAVITETALNWTFAEYAGHLWKEHEYMKTHKPEDNPDMKKM